MPSEGTFIHTLAQATTCTRAMISTRGAAKTLDYLVEMEGATCTTPTDAFGPATFSWRDVEVTSSHGPDGLLNAWLSAAEGIEESAA